MSAEQRDAAALSAIAGMSDEQRRRALTWISGYDLPITEAAVQFIAHDTDLDDLINLTELALTDVVECCHNSRQDTHPCDYQGFWLCDDGTHYLGDCPDDNQAEL